MKKIPLSRGMFAIVDDDDFDSLSKHKWCAHRGGGTWYATRNIVTGSRTTRDRKWKMIMMHREILGELCVNRTVDHVNGDGLDNRRSNIRVASRAENMRNIKPRKHSSVYKGVGIHNGRWRSRIMIDGKTVYVGIFDSEIDAAKAYNQAAIKHYGQFARLNKVVD